MIYNTYPVFFRWIYWKAEKPQRQPKVPLEVGRWAAPPVSHDSTRWSNRNRRAPGPRGDWASDASVIWFNPIGSVCMPYMVTFAIYIPHMLAYTPYMDPSWELKCSPNLGEIGGKHRLFGKRLRWSVSVKHEWAAGVENRSLIRWNGSAWPGLQF